MATTVWESVVPATMCTGVDTVALSPGWQMVTDGFTELSVQLPPLVEPVPLRVTVCGLLAAESVMVRVPLRVPAAVGVNVTVIVHPPLPASNLPPLLPSEEWPLEAMLLIATALAV